MDYTTGGTFRYCQLETTITVKTPKFDKLGRKTRYFNTETVTAPCVKRLRTDAAIRRHLRRKHSAPAL